MKKIIIKNKGFTIIEMMICITLVTAFSVMFLSSRSLYTDRLSLRNETYKIASYVRQAQVNSLGVIGYTTSTIPTTFNTSYGVSFEGGPPVGTNNFHYYTDENLDGKLDLRSEPFLTIPLSNGVKVMDICGYNNSGATVCESGSALVKLDISFRRPYPAATIAFLNAGRNIIGSIRPPALIYVQSPRGVQSIIRVDITGAVSIQ